MLLSSRLIFRVTGQITNATQLVISGEYVNWAKDYTAICITAVVTWTVYNLLYSIKLLSLSKSRCFILKVLLTRFNDDLWHYRPLMPLHCKQQLTYDRNIFTVSDMQFNLSSNVTAKYVVPYQGYRRIIITHLSVHRRHLLITRETIFSWHPSLTSQYFDKLQQLPTSYRLG